MVNTTVNNFQIDVLIEKKITSKSHYWSFTTMIMTIAVEDCESANKVQGRVEGQNR